MKQHSNEIIEVDFKTKESEMEEDLHLYPEKIYFRNFIIIGDLPRLIDLNKLFSYFDDISFWKLIGQKVIPDLRNPNFKAVILIYEDEESARICNLRFKTASNITFTLYDGISFFYYCKQLDLTCDVRSRNVLIYSTDCDKSRETYLEILGVFGTISYFEFCEGEIPKVRVEFTRATSAFAAVLNLQDTFDHDSVISLEVPLFPIYPISPIHYNSVPPPVKLSLDTSQVTEEMKEHAFMLCTMNIYQQDQHTFTNVNGIPENTVFQNESVEECMMEAVSFGISRKLFREKVNSHRTISKYMQDYFDRTAQKNLKKFLQSTKKIMSFNNVWNEMISPLMQQKM